MKPSPYVAPAVCLILLMMLSVACGESVQPAAGKDGPSLGTVPAQVPAHPRQEDLSRYMPKENRVSATLTPGSLFGLETLPPATIAEYKKGARTYQQFLFKAQSEGMAAVYLGHAKNAMSSAKFVAGFGGYYGEIGGQPVFAFVKGAYVAGLTGLSLADADAEGRLVAARIP